MIPVLEAATESVWHIINCPDVWDPAVLTGRFALHALVLLEEPKELVDPNLSHQSPMLTQWKIDRCMSTDRRLTEVL